MIDHVLALPEGYRLQEYTIRRTLGFGGFGITYEALDTHLDKIVAIKEYLPSDLAVRLDGSTVSARSDQDREGFQWGRERFLAEARTVARFDHPNIIRIYRFFEENGTGYIVMEFVDGRPLSDLLRERGSLDESQIRAWLWPILDGLKVIHQANFLHRDIKPQNIMIRPDGSPVLLDFGAARVAIGGQTRSLTSILTPGFAPLEQYQSRGNQGPWTDIYALGAVLYCCIAGRKPMDALDRVTEDRLEPPDTNAVHPYSPGLVNGVMAALAVREHERPQEIDQWMAILEDHGSGPTRIMRPGQAEPDRTLQAPREGDEPAKTTGRGKLRPGLIVALPLIFGLAAAGAWVLWNLPGWRSPGPEPGSGVDIDQAAQTPETATPDRPADVPGEVPVAAATPREEAADFGQVQPIAASEDPDTGQDATDGPIPALPPPRYALTIEPDPAHAEVRFLNIDETYRPGISLEPGRYEVEVSLPGYQTVMRTLEIFDQARTIPIALRPLAVSQQAALDVAPEPAPEEDNPPGPADSAPSLVIVTSCENKNPTASVTPTYPQRALARGIEGRVTLAFTVDSDGRVIDPRISSAEPAGVFENAALEAIRQFRYRPNSFGGEDHPCLTTQELKFELR